MANKAMLLAGGLAVVGAIWYSTKEEAPVLEDTQAKSFTQVSGDGDADARTQTITSGSDLLDECALNENGEATGGNTTNTCITPLYKANETIRILHPIAENTQLPNSLREKFEQYYFDVHIEGDVGVSMIPSAWESYPADKVIGDYQITITRGGGSWFDYWTANQYPDFGDGSKNKGAYLTKSNAMNPADSVLPTWDEILNAYGGYNPDYVAAIGESIIFEQGYFDDVGSWKYEKQLQDGSPYPVSTNYFGLDMAGNEIPLYAQLQYRCGTSGSYTDAGSSIQVTSQNTVTSGSSTRYPATIPTSGVALGCALPTVSISYPSKIHVYCDEEAGQDCSNVLFTNQKDSQGNAIRTYAEWWNLNNNVNTPTTMQKGGYKTPSGAVWAKLFNAYGTPRVYSDNQGWYIYQAGTPRNKHYIDTILPGFKAAYTRQSITCTCPSDTNLEGTSFVLEDKDKCPGKILGVYGGTLQDEWKTTYCGGLKPKYGCTDSRANNYSEFAVKDPTDNDVCNPKYCDYGLNQILPECQDLGGDDLPGSGGGVGEAPVDGTGDTDESPPPPSDGGGGWGGNTPGTGGNWGGGGNNWNIGMAENVIRPSKLINTSQSFLNW